MNIIRAYSRQQALKPPSKEPKSADAFSDEQLAALKYQIYAFKLLAANKVCALEPQHKLELTFIKAFARLVDAGLV